MNLELEQEEQAELRVLLDAQQAARDVLGLKYRLLAAVMRATGGKRPSAHFLNSAPHLGHRLAFQFPNTGLGRCGDYDQQTIADLLAAFPPGPVERWTWRNQVEFRAAGHPPDDGQVEAVGGVVLRTSSYNPSLSLDWYTRVAGVDVQLLVTVPLATQQLARSYQRGGYREKVFEANFDGVVQRYGPMNRNEEPSYAVYYPLGSETEAWTPGEWARLAYPAEVSNPTQ